MKAYSIFKRLFDITLSLILLPFVLIIAIIGGVVLAFELKEFPIFIQKRSVNTQGKEFNLIKLKTLKTNSVANSVKLEDWHVLANNYNEEITPFAGWLRLTGLDEITQIFNILSGSMSFVGPRPLMKKDLNYIREFFPQLNEIKESINSKPGISGLWQVFCNREFGVENLIYLDSLYNLHKSFLLDIKILIYTLAVVLTATNSDALKNTQLSESTKVVKLSHKGKLNSYLIGKLVPLPEHLRKYL
ncbi:MAG: sugar transferase [Bacteroidetes bacterium]|nr:sugar transferase [Bacteroidota bacterium]MBU1678957.1 sugar transferase [Bacteroidota bacterium]